MSGFPKATRSQRFAELALSISLLWAGNSTGPASEYRDKGYQYLSPLPGAEYAPPRTRFVLVRFEHITPHSLTNLSSFIQVTGADSGNHSGGTRIATDGRTVIFEMSADFQINELVTVALNPLLEAGTAGTVEPYEYQFAISAPMPGAAPMPIAPLPGPVDTSPESKSAVPEHGPLRGRPEVVELARILPNGVSVPSDFPQITVSTKGEPSPGHIFLANPGQTGQPYAFILDQDGNPVWYQRGGGPNFRVQANGMITWGSGIAFDENFNVIRGYSTVNGYGPNWHEFRLLADGTRLMIGDWAQKVDMTRYLSGANPRAEVQEQAVQMFTAAGDLVFQFRGWDHYDVRDLKIVDPLGGSFGFPHMNALTVDQDGHILVSCRNLNEVTKINRDTGEIIWRLGGAHSDFTFVNDPGNGFSAQHDISALGGGRYLLFDNGNLHKPLRSRAVEYQLDFSNMTASLVWEFHDTPERFTDVMGNAQRLPDGHTLINFVQGDHPRIIEVDPSGVKQLELDLVPYSQIYRALKFPWSGVLSVPSLIAEAYPENVTLIFNKFGDTNVAYYRIYGGMFPGPTNLLTTSTTTLSRLTDLENGHRYYFRVTAVDPQGKESDYSNQGSVLVNLTRPGQNLLLNGDFAQGTNFWTWKVDGTASANWTVAEGTGHAAISAPGSQLANIQVSQAELKLIQGREYVLEFDARAMLPRLIEVRLEQNQSPGTAYQVATCSLTPLKQHFSYSFAMQNGSDLNVRIVFSMGASAADVYLSDILLAQIAPGDFNRDRRVGLEDLRVLAGQWLQSGSSLSADLNADGRVDFEDFGILGQDWSRDP